jgi:exodeoxyribonuclease VII large subunit
MKSETHSNLKPQNVYSVSRLNRETRFLLNDNFGRIWVEGEISNLALPSSGHLYFTLKDYEAQIRCAMFRGQARQLGFQPENGDHVLLQAEVSLYEPRGDYQLIVEWMEETGDGALMRAFELLKQRLAAEGLFDAIHKQPIPVMPRCLGVITSPTGAAIRDILVVLKRRFPALPVIVFPVKVQGNEAKFEIVRAIQTADRLKWCDVLILARGGGSLEDLWAFNEEIVAHAMAACETPIVTGIGHEIDFTIADFVADLRAPTPSAAAEAVSPDGIAMLNAFEQWEIAFRQRLRALLNRHTSTVAALERRLQLLHPTRRLQVQSQRLDELEVRLRRSWHRQLSHAKTRLQTQSAHLTRHHPGQRLRLLQLRHDHVQQRLARAIRQILDQHQQTMAALAEQLQAVSPLATLARGYCIAQRCETGQVLRSFQEISPGELMETRLAEGTLMSRVEVSLDS